MPMATTIYPHMCTHVGMRFINVWMGSLMRLSIALLSADIGRKNTVRIDSIAHLMIARTASINGLRSPFKNHDVTIAAAVQINNICMYTFILP